MKLKPLAAAVLPLGAVLVSASDLLGQGKVRLEGNPFQEWNNKTIMIVSPHPDDDIIGCGGGRGVLRRPGKRFVFFLLTKWGKRRLDTSPSPPTLTKRHQHQTAAPCPTPLS